ncbi:DUF7657 domain-containing protein [Arthrobacter sp. 9AX]|uniref:DUF7657 domain-containing protein n=1 Tax=Arthrobacter sp. 9AX TaxID=2653131 RepID=UPI00135A0C13|nr:hypothetical protein [Arthrobacter sp. 9AX]
MTLLQSRSSLAVPNKRRIKEWLIRNDNILKLLVIVAYILATLLGATTSSIGMSTLRQDPANPLGYQVGDSSPIRADEYNAFSPIVLSIMATGGAPTTSVLAAAADLVHRYPSGGFFETFVFFDSTLLRTAQFLPDAMVFAAHWWLPALVLFLFLPKWFTQIGAGRRWGWLAATLIALSPAASWWTMMPIQLIAYTLAGSSLLLSAYKRFALGQRLIPVAQCITSGILLAGLPSFYIPWSLVLGLPLLSASVAWIFAARGAWRPKIMALATAGSVAVIFAAGMLWENRAGIAALLETVYPGSRRSTGAAQPFGMLFGAPALGSLRDMTPVGSNESELSTAYTITFVLAALLLVGLREFGKLRDNVVLIVMSVFGLIWLAWCTVNFGDRGAAIPLLNYVQPARAAQVCGILGAILVCLVLSRLQQGKNLRIAAVAGVVCGLISAYAASALQQSYLPVITQPLILAVAAAVALATFCLVRFHTKLWPLILTAALVTLPVIDTNPLLFGLGDLRASDTATYLREEGKTAAARGEVWVSDSPALDTVMLANGVPSLSGVQRSGPNKAAWSKLDPESEHAHEWNRGGGFIYFQWLPGQPVTFDNNGSDSAIVRADPCELKQKVPNLAGITSLQVLTSSCLVPGRVLTWSGQTMFVYKFL